MTSASAKLTLSLDREIIKSAKKYAQKRGKSVSKIVQDYLSSISKTDSKVRKEQLGPVTQELHGVLKGKLTSDYRSDLADYIEKKYK
ncbi:MAG: antitoxin [Spirochaetes bacterium]|nr:antitoxin [Spirochaetota bacterium]